MEKRAILAAVLMAALLMIYQTFFLPSEPPKAPPATQPGTAQAPPPAPEPAGSPRPEAPAPSPAPPVAPEPRTTPGGPRPPQRLATVEAPRYRAVVSSEGGKLQEFVLKYRGDKPMVVLGDLGPGGLVLQSGESRAVVPMELNRESLTLGPLETSGDLVLRGEESGLRVQETLRFRAYTYTIEAFVRVENPGQTPRTVTVSLPWSTRESWKGATEKFTGQHPHEILWATDGQVVRVEDLSAVGNHVVDGSWVGVGSIWYLAAMLPKTPGFKVFVAGEPKPADDKQPAARATIGVMASPTIAPGRAWEGHVVIYAGPKELDRLKELGLEEAINFGGFPVPRKWGGLPMEWLGVPILRLMNWVYSHVGNYGVAIILLTIISKILFFPLTIKSMRSMKGMQALTPQVNALRSKYKNDPQRLQKETLELYRHHKVNPMGGCLPMVAQIPIFYALYLALSVSVELQNAPFLCFGRAPSWLPGIGGVDLWICDLASHDPTYVLPILMGVSMFLQQKMTPVMGDPRQAKMMLFMPFVFTFMFFNVASGLVLYWFLSNVLQIMQQWYLDRPKSPKGAGREAKHAARA